MCETASAATKVTTKKLTLIIMKSPASELQQSQELSLVCSPSQPSYQLLTEPTRIFREAHH